MGDILDHQHRDHRGKAADFGSAAALVGGGHGAFPLIGAVGVGGVPAVGQWSVCYRSMGWRKGFTVCSFSGAILQARQGFTDGVPQTGGIAQPVVRLRRRSKT
jgi:hypothetical protein